MQERPKVGSHVFIVESNQSVTEVIVAAIRGEFYTLRFINGGAIKLRQSRVFLSKEEAEKKLPMSSKNKRRFQSPYDYGM